MRIRPIVFLCLLTLLWPAASARGGGEMADRQLVILFTHDLHSYLAPVRVVNADGHLAEQGGYARLARLLADARARYANRTVTLDAGDYSMGTLFHTISPETAIELRLMGRMGYDATTFGNHDFDLGPAHLAAMLQQAKASGDPLPGFVASNFTLNPEDRSLASAFADYPVMDYILLERNGLRIGLFGLMGRDAGQDIVFSRDVTFSSIADAARRVTDILRNKEKADVVIALSHSGTSPDAAKSEDELLARAVPDIDVILSGHTHTVLPTPLQIGKTLVVSAGCYGAYLGILRLDLNDPAGAKLVAYDLEPVTGDVVADPSITQQVSQALARVDTEFLSRYGMTADQVIATSGFDFESLASLYAEPRETGLGNLITDAYRDAVLRADPANTDPPIVVEPIGMIRDSLVRGPVTVGDIFRVLSLGLGPDDEIGYPLLAFYLTGDEVKRLLEVDASVAPLAKEDAHLQVSGIRFVHNPHRVPLDRVTRITVARSDGTDEPLVPQHLYRTVMNTWMAKNLTPLSDKTLGLLRIVPKDRDGRPVADLRDAIVDADPGTPGKQELKEWLALAGYLKQFTVASGPGAIPDRYRHPEGRIAAAPSWNPVDLVAGGNAITLAAGGIVALVAVAVGLGAWTMARRVFRGGRTRVAPTHESGPTRGHE